METSVEVSDAPIGFGQAPGKSIGNRVRATTRTRDFGRDYRGLICSGANEKRRGDQPKVAAPLFIALSLQDDVGGGCSYLGSGAVGVVGGQELFADAEAEGEQAAGLDFGGVVAEGGDHFPE